MQYSTLQEAYSINTFKPTATKKKTTPIYQSNPQQLYSIENSSLASNKEKVDYGNYDSSINNDIFNSVKKSNNVGSCAPIQAPTYNIPISGNCKKEMNVAINTYTDNNARENTINDNVEKYNNYTASDIAINNNGVNNNVNNDSILPFYDEDMEQYFDINNLKDEVNYKSNSNNKINNYMPNYNKISYTNDNTNEYSNNNNKYSNGINLLNTNEYNLSEDEKKKAFEALDYLKSIEKKINSDKNNLLDDVKSSEITGPGGFIVKDTEDKYNANNNNLQKKHKDEIISAHDAKLIESIKENKKTQNIFNMLINIFIFVFIGVLIILLCDYMAELAIQIGSTKTANTLEPYIKYHMLYMQILANNNANMSIKKPDIMSNTDGEMNHFGYYNMPNMPNMSNMSNMPNMPNMPNLSKS